VVWEISKEVSFLKSFKSGLDFYQLLKGGLE